MPDDRPARQPHPRADPLEHRGHAQGAGLLGQRPALKVSEITNWRKQLADNREAALATAAVAGFVIGGGVAATVSLLPQAPRPLARLRLDSRTQAVRKSSLYHRADGRLRRCSSD